MATFFETISEAINYFTENGFGSTEKLEFWVKAIRDAAARTMTPDDVLERELKRTFGAVYQAQIERGGILQYHSGVTKFTLQQVKPRLRRELDRRIMAAASQIKLNREEVMADTLRRFSGWATSIPDGGTDIAKRKEIKDQIRKPLASMPFKARRCIIDQSHKLTSSLSEIVALDNGALAGIWHSEWRRIGYNFRPDHKHRDENVYVVRGNWALEQGLMKPDGHLYTDDLTKPGEEVYCSCRYQWIYNLRSLPNSMLTEKCRSKLAAARIAT